jgi:hypothetical protein
MSINPLYRPNQLILEAAKHGELVVFVGAGASMICGSPDWRGFSNQIVKALEKSSVLNFLEAEQLRGMGDPRRILSIARELAKENRLAIDYDNILHPTMPEGNGIELYRLLASLRPVFVTTNYDRWLDEAAPEELSIELESGEESEPAKRPSRRPKYYLREHLTPALLAERGSVIHLHGSYTEPDSMVVSLKDYIEHYADNRVQTFLSSMFRNYTVLFVGYGLAELEILEHIIRSNESLKSETAELRHFLLYAHKSTELAQTNFVERFFREQCGVSVIKYCIDTRGYPEILELFKSWSPQLDVRDPGTLDLQMILDRLVADPTEVNRHTAMSLLEKQPELISYFLNSLNDVVWFEELDHHGLFNPRDNPNLKVVENAESQTHQAEGWAALRYLEQIVAAANGEQINRIMEIVRDITSDAQQRRIDNWRTWWSLAAVFSKMPLASISENDIEMVRIWLDSRFDANMVGQQLGESLLPRLLDSPEQANWQKALLLVDELSKIRPTKVRA